MWAGKHRLLRRTNCNRADVQLRVVRQVRRDAKRKRVCGIGLRGKPDGCRIDKWRTRRKLMDCEPRAGESAIRLVRVHPDGDGSARLDARCGNRFENSCSQREERIRPGNVRARTVGACGRSGRKAEKDRYSASVSRVVRRWRTESHTSAMKSSWCPCACTNALSCASVTPC